MRILEEHRVRVPILAKLNPNSRKREAQFSQNRIPRLAKAARRGAPRLDELRSAARMTTPSGENRAGWGPWTRRPGLRGLFFVLGLEALFQVVDLALQTLRQVSSELGEVFADER
jgi:hypothetical protein